MMMEHGYSRTLRALLSGLVAGVLLAIGGCTGVAEDDDMETSPTPEGTDADLDGVTVEAGDCDDQNADIYPGAAELCDGIDNNCNGELDGASSVDARDFYLDADRDAYGLTDTVLHACSAPTGYAAVGGDCDDLNPLINPGASEICDGKDNDCDGELDGGNASDAADWYPDVDSDGYGNSSRLVHDCDAPANYISVGGDCDDTNPTIHPDAIESCDGKDNDCDGLTDELGATGGTLYYADKDKDGYGDPTATLTACSSVNGYVLNDDDCDDTNPSRYPGAPEKINGVDDDCDGLIDEGAPQEDGDGDGYTPAQGDCNDGNAAVHPNAVEGVDCDGIDQNCDGRVDEGTSCFDDDGDGFSEQQGDCDDVRSAVYPGAIEAFNARDEDCDGLVDEGAIPEGALIVTEFVANGLGPNDAYGEWFELYNSTAIPIDLYLWSFHDNYVTKDPSFKLTIGSHLEVLPGKYVVLSNCADQSINGGVPVDYAFYNCQQGNFGLANSPSTTAPEYIKLYDPTLRLIDAITWSIASSENVSSQLDLRYYTGVANDSVDDATVWCTQLPTPGAKPLQPCTPL